MKLKKEKSKKKDPLEEICLETPVNHIPKYLFDAFDTYKIEKDAVKLSVKLDLAEDFRFEENWLLVTEKELLRISGTYIAEKGWSPGEFYIYDLDVFKRFRTENLPTSGVIIAEKEEMSQILCRYSNARARDVALFLKLLDTFREKGVISEDDLKDLGVSENKCSKCGRSLRPNESIICSKCVDKKKVFFRLLSYAKQYRKQIVIILIYIALAAVFQTLFPYISGKVYMDDVLNANGKYYGMVVQVVLALIGVQVISLFLNALSGRITARLASDVVYRLKTDTFKAMQRLSIKFFLDKQTGNLMTRINQDSNEVQWFFIDGLPYLLFNSVHFLGVFAMMMAMSPSVTLLVMIPILFIYLFLKKFMPRFYKMFNNSHRKRAAMNSQLNDSLSGIKVVKAFGKETQEVQSFGKTSEQFANVEERISKTASTVFPLNNLLMWMGSLGIYLFGGIQVIEGNVLFGDLTAMLGYVGMIYGPLQWFTRLVQNWSQAMQAANRVFEVLDAVSLVPEKENPISIPFEGHVKIDDVCFSYEPNVPVLENINLDVKPGEMIGVVGHSGAGKSTLINLITRLYDVDSGGIYIDGVNVKDLSFECLRSQVGIVLQDTYLFMGTVAANIAYAKPDATMDEIVRAAKEACAHTFIMNLPDGYDTMIGVGGQGLSGGERQRLALARAVLKNPRILILDEATSAVDTKTEWLIQKALEKLADGRTTFNIAHRLSTLRNADRLIVLDQGKLAECGTHEELYAQEGVYHNLYQIQKEALKVRGIEK